MELQPAADEAFLPSISTRLQRTHSVSIIMFNVWTAWSRGLKPPSVASLCLLGLTASCACSSAFVIWKVYSSVSPRRASDMWSVKKPLLWFLQNRNIWAIWEQPGFSHAFSFECMFMCGTVGPHWPVLCCSPTFTEPQGRSAHPLLSASCFAHHHQRESPLLPVTAGRQVIRRLSRIRFLPPR